jgi:hypothetical protein
MQLNFSQTQTGRMKKPKRDAQIDVGAPDNPDLLP